ncbi:MAG: hypothetical protein EBR02_01165 [Alphaproteobacteria bacterium]|nr:hypothetical protein [Alphaproteobacteria bacterium]
MKSELPIFEELVASEAAIRGMSVIRHRGFREINLPHSQHSTTNMDAGSRKNEIAEALFQHYLQIYDFQFQDSSQYRKQDPDGKLYNARHLDAGQQDVIKKIFQRFVDENYSETGDLKLTQDTAPGELAKLYEAFNSPAVALKHATMSLGVMLVELARDNKWKSITPNGIDFTRGERTSDIEQRMRSAIHENNATPQGSHFIDPPGKENVWTVEGISFPVKKIDGKTHVVTENGCLVDLTRELAEAIETHVRSRKSIRELEIDVPVGAPHLAHFMEKKYCGFHLKNESPQQSGEKARKLLGKNLKRLKEAKVIDGASLIDKKVRLFCIDEDLMTGLLMKPRSGEEKSELAIFKEAMANYGKVHKDFSNIIDFIPKDAHPNFHDLEPSEQATERKKIKAAIKVKMLEVAGEISPPAQELIKRAAPRLAETLEKVYECADNAFIGKEGRKKPAEKPQVYLAQGGTGSGKGGLKKLAKKECGDSLVVASLDDMRGDSDKLWLYPALELHHDDYIAVGDFGNAVRALTMQKAEQEKYNLFIDGSGIPYEGRNDKVAKQFKDRGYHVSVLGAQAPLSLYQPGSTSRGMFSDVVMLRAGARLQDELRFVPMKEVIKKHTGHPIAAHNAARDPNVDRFMIMDTSPVVNQSYTLSYVVDIPAPVFDSGLGTLKNEQLHAALQQNHLIPNWVEWPDRIPGEEKIPAGMTKSELKVVGVKPDGGKGEIYHVEVIINMPQYVNMVQKGLYNENAQGPESLFDNHIKCDINGTFKGHEKGRLRLQPALGVGEVKWPAYTPPLGNKLMWGGVNPECFSRASLAGPVGRLP